MRAAIKKGLLGAGGIAFTKDHPLPLPDESSSPGGSEVYIKVKSAGINPVDYKLPGAISGKVVGIDVSGVVERVGSDVSDLKAGDGVFGRVPLGAKWGSLADYALVDVEELAAKPDYLSYEEAASIGVAYLTGLECLKQGNVKEGSTVLVIGASGGCGIAGVQLAVAKKAARIVGICSGKNFDFVKEMSGVEKAEGLELVDYTDEAAMKKFREENVGEFDCIYDTATGSGMDEDYTSTMPGLLKEKTGEYVQINGSPSTWMRFSMGRMPPQRKMVLTPPKGRAALEEVASLLKSTGAKPYLTVKAFDEQGVKEGFEQLKGRRTKGKIVFSME